ncbi:MAG: elongation factor G [Clostridia bacterium]|nr:MAG: elongation factor G [Clostridia bacterium]
MIERIRNVAVVAHGGAGKTSLTEAMLFDSGAIKRMGRVEDGNTTTDFQPEEIKRRVTTTLAVAPCSWRDHKINLLDTPGYGDFIGEVKSALRVADGAMVLLDAVAGVEVQTEVVWDYAEEAGLPRVAFVNKMDRENADFYKALERMQASFASKKMVVCQLPVGAAENFRGMVDLLAEKAYILVRGTGEAQETAVPEDMSENVARFRDSLIEAAAEADDELLMRYLDGEELSLEDIRLGLRQGILKGEIVPILCGSATNNMGIRQLLDFLVDFMPSPLDRQGATAEALTQAPLAALIFKTLADPYIGRMSYLRVYQGVLQKDSIVYNANQEIEEKVGSLLQVMGKNQQPVDRVEPGDIAAVAKLQASVTGTTLTVKSSPQVLPGISFPEPTLPVAISPKSRGDEEKLSSALSRLLEEDTTIRLEKNTETKQTILKGMGELHVDITLERLQRKFGVEVETGELRVPYRETIRVPVSRVEGKYKKQTGGHGQYGHVFLDMSPLADESFNFSESIFGGAVPKQYIPAVEKGIREAIQEGALAGYPVTNVKVTLVDGSYHPVDSSEMAFKIAAGMAFRKAMEQAKPVLLEPVMNVEVRVPEAFMGDIIGDLNSKRGRILGMEPQGKTQVIKGQVPLAEMYRYAIDLKSITQGRGSFKMEFSHYEEVPANLAEHIIQEARAAREAKAE